MFAEHCGNARVEPGSDHKKMAFTICQRCVCEAEALDNIARRFHAQTLSE